MPGQTFKAANEHLFIGIRRKCQSQAGKKRPAEAAVVSSGQEGGRASGGSGGLWELRRLGDVSVESHHASRKLQVQREQTKAYLINMTIIKCGQGTKVGDGTEPKG